MLLKVLLYARSNFGGVFPSEDISNTSILHKQWINDKLKEIISVGKYMNTDILKSGKWSEIHSVN
jgi:hypothetical protein